MRMTVTISAQDIVNIAGSEIFYCIAQINSCTAYQASRCSNYTDGWCESPLLPPCENGVCSVLRSASLAYATKIEDRIIDLDF